MKKLFLFPVLALLLTHAFGQVALSTGNTNATCNSSSDGSAWVTASGGTPPYAYQWSNADVTDTINSLPAGTYVVTVTDASSATATASVNVNTPTALVTNETVTNITCYGAANGSVTVTITGGTLPYSFSWSNGATSNNLSGLASGTYSITATDANGCSTTAISAVSQPSQIIVSDSTGNATCGAANGSVTLFVNGGTAPYSYLWSNTAIGQPLVSATAGSYVVTVTDNNACTVTASATVNGSGSSITLSNTTTNALCYGAATGSITVTVSGGAVPYSYLWSNSSTTSNITNLNAGSYTVTVTDANGCSATAFGTITQPTQIIVNDSTGNAACGSANGSVTLFVNNGTAPYTYLWSNSTTAQTLVSAPAGNYTVTVTDANACTATVSALVNGSSSITVSNTTINALCHGAATGSVSITASNGTSPYTYDWSNGATTSGITNINAGSYAVTVTDATGCSTSAFYNVTQATQITVNDSTGNAACGLSNGSATLFVNGGTAPYTYLWSNSTTAQTLVSVQAGNYTVTVTDANTCTVTAVATVTSASGLTASVSATAVTCFGQANGSATATVSGGTVPYSYDWSNSVAIASIANLAGGTYTVTVTDANGCSVTATGTVTQPTQITVAPNVSNPSCNGTTGSVSLTVSGGTSGYTYVWSNGSTTSSVSNLPGSTTYTVTITDANSCTATASASLGSAVQLSDSAVSQTNASCYGSSTGALHIGTSGGSGNYIYTWSNSDSTAIIANLSVGTYSITITDLSSGCSVTASYTITQPTQVTVASNISASTACYGSTPNGSVSLNVSGGTSPYAYAWSNGSTSASLSAIGYDSLFVTVTDANGCAANNALYVSGKAQFTCTFTLSPDSVVAHKWYLNYNFSGSYPASFTWSWGDGDTSTGSQPTHTYSDSGFYNICMTLTDTAGCTANYCSNSTFLRSDTGAFLIGVVVIPPPQVITTAVQNVNENHFVIYPNPANDLIHVNTGLAGIIHYQVYNALGQLVIQNISSSNNFDITINNLSSGLYFVKLKAGNNEAAERFIKQ